MTASVRWQRAMEPEYCRSLTISSIFLSLACTPIWTSFVRGRRPWLCSSPSYRVWRLKGTSITLCTIQDSSNTDKLDTDIIIRNKSLEEASDLTFLAAAEVSKKSNLIFRDETIPVGLKRNFVPWYAFWGKIRKGNSARSAIWILPNGSKTQP